jgi:hypothetical protein
MSRPKTANSKRVLERLNELAYQMCGPGYNVLGEVDPKSLSCYYALYYWNERLIGLGKNEYLAETELRLFLSDRTRTRWIPR